MNFCVYVLQNREQRCYVGLMDDLLRRVEQHNHGVSTWTKHRGPWELVWQSETMELGEARQLETWLKRQKGGNGFYERTGLARRSGSSSR